jgi:hypothetical protein
MDALLYLPYQTDVFRCTILELLIGTRPLPHANSISTIFGVGLIACLDNFK